MDTTVFLIRHGITDWHAEGKLLGRTDRPLNAEGAAQSQRAADALGSLAIAEVLSSPLQRALSAAEPVGQRAGIEVARDHRLTDISLGGWEGKRLSDLVVSPTYRELLVNPQSESARPPGGEGLEEVRKRAVSAIEQALEDNPSGDGIAIVTHAVVIRVLLAHYLGAPLVAYQRLQVAPGSISVLSFTRAHLPRVLAVGWCGELGALLGQAHIPAFPDPDASEAGQKPR